MPDQQEVTNADLQERIERIETAIGLLHETVNELMATVDDIIQAVRPIAERYASSRVMQALANRRG